MRISTVPAHQLVDGEHVNGAAMAQVDGRTGERRQDLRGFVDLRGVVVVGVEGDIDLHTGPDLRWVLADLLTTSTTTSGADRRAGEGDPAAEVNDLPVPVRAVIVDLTAVDFIDSYAIGVLVQGHHLARRSGAAYALIATHPMIHTLFAMTGLAKVLPLHPDVAAALADLPVATPFNRL